MNFQNNRAVGSIPKQELERNILEGELDADYTSCTTTSSRVPPFRFAALPSHRTLLSGQQGTVLE
jgi:hypothetical protein